MALAAVSLDDKYTLESGRVYLTGIQALVRLPMIQRQRDLEAGLNTACFISGYRGSPLGGYDQQLWRSRSFLERNHIHFQPGVNEDLAATAIWGSQQLGLFGGAKYDGVFGIWYGKGPGVDRCGDVFKHANFAGAAKHGGVLCLAGDDHIASSSTLPHQSEYAFMSAMMPVLNPSGVQEFLDFGLHGWAMSRFSGCWTGFKTVAETVESSASVYVDPHRVEIRLPEFEVPEGGMNIRWPDLDFLDQEARLHRHRLYAALAYSRENRLDRVVLDSPVPRLGIVTTGKSYLDVRQALDDLGIDEALAAEIGIRLYKVGMPWPLEPEGVRAFASGLEEIIVIEEKRALIENQIKEQFYNWSENTRPRVIGKFDEAGEWILPSSGDLSPARIARVVADRIDRFFTSETIRDRLAFLEGKERALADATPSMKRVPWFCPGCPHNTSTKVPEGSRAMAGIGCHYMALWMDRDTSTFTHMGGEGVPWIGQAPFTDEKHVFANLGDGTYHHSGILAVRACVDAGVNMTFKLLYNDAVAMTGGQPLGGALTVPAITRQLEGEGVRRIAVVSDEPRKYPVGSDFAAGVSFHHRDDLDAVQRDLREYSGGVSVLVYDQTCAAEKRRRRKRGTYPDPDRRLVINEEVCEGCGDCSVQSNCLAVVPVETELGRKRAIDQSACNKDWSCLKGFCPSFVSVEGGRLRQHRPGPVDDSGWQDLPEPVLPTLDDGPWGIVVTGVGGTGVITISALLGIAAHIEGRGVSVLDMTGLAQKGGAVISHIRIAREPEEIHAVRIAAGEARAVIGCDLMVAAGFDAVAKMRAGHTKVVVNNQETITGEFTHQRDLAFPAAELADVIREATGPGDAEFVDATRLATALLGDSIATNLFMVGYAWQKGLVPLSGEALDRAIELNGVAIEANRRALLWGRRAAIDPEGVARVATPPARLRPRDIATGLDEVVARRVAFLGAYQNQALADRYRDLVGRAEAAEGERAKGMTGLADAVARNWYRLLAIKDEYEVARLFTDGRFLKRIGEEFEGDYRLRFHLAPPLLAQRDPVTGHLRKKEFGPWMIPAFRVLAALRGLRGSFMDPFGYTAERRAERRLIVDYERVVGEILEGLDTGNHALAVRIASLPDNIRGFGHIKERAIAGARATEAALLEEFRNPASAASAAE